MMQVLTDEQNSQVTEALKSTVQMATTALSFVSPENTLAVIKSAKAELETAERTIERAMDTHFATY